MESGRSDEALVILQELVDNPSLLFPADAALMELARGQEASGMVAEAEDTYRRLAVEHPQSVYAGDAAQAVARLSNPANASS
jgi:lipopolysaccharide biosynthesis regulator YciM